MGYNYTSELKKFEKEWEQDAKYYAEHGMSQSDIAILREDALEEFNKNRTFMKRNQSLTSEDTETDTFFPKKYADGFTTEYDTGAEHSRFWWIEEINCEAVAAYCKQLSDFEKEIITLAVYDGYTHAEIANMVGWNRRTLTDKINNILGNIALKYMVNLPKAEYRSLSKEKTDL